MNDREQADNREVNQSKDPQLQGGPDIDTTHLDRPAGLNRPDEEMVGGDRAEWGPKVLSDEVLSEPGSLDPTGDDPFVPNTPELRDDRVDSEHQMTDRDRKTAEMMHRDPTGEKGPTYEREQGDRDIAGGSVDPHSALTHDSSGRVDERWKERADVDPSGD